MSSAPGEPARLSPADADYQAAMHEVQSNLEVRRLMLVLTNVLTPTCVMAVSDCLSGSDHGPALAWLPPIVLPLAGALLLASGVLVTGVVARCHFGLVINGTKMHKVLRGELRLQALNWLGVTTNFVALTAVSTGLGAICLAAGLGAGWWSLAAGAAAVVATLLWLPLAHRRANRRCRQLDVHWEPSQPSRELREQHARQSLDGTAADISVVVVMAVALFAGVFNALTNLGGVPDGLEIVPSPAALKAHATPLLAAFLLLSQLLSCRILVRLRLAFGQHSRELAELRGEHDETALRWQLQERTFLLYAIVLVLAAASALVLGIDRAGRAAGLLAALGVLVAGAAWYPLVLAAARRRAAHP